MTDARERRAAEQRAHIADKQFVSVEAERIEQAAKHLRTATFLSPGSERSTVVAEVVALLEQAITNLKERI